MSRTQLSIAIPLYNEGENVPELYRRLKLIVKEQNKSYEVVFANDGSQDNTLEELVRLHKLDRNVKIVSLSRNFGHEAAVTAALDNTCGETVVLMDGDLQDAPEFIPQLLSKLDEGYDIVYAQHPRRNDSLLMRLCTWSFYLLLDKLASYKLPMDVGAFSAMRRPVVDVLSAMSERNRFVAGLRAWVGFHQTGVEYEKQARFSGRPVQTFAKLLRMGLDALFSFSYLPLRLATILGLVVTVGSFFVTLNVLYQKYIAQTAIIGWSGPMLSILIIGGAQLVMLGIVGEYLGRIYDEVKRRPYYIVSARIGFAKD